MNFRAKHLLGIEHLAPDEIVTLLDLAEQYVDLSRSDTKHSEVLAGLTQINMFFENSTRTQASFEIAGKRLGADVMNMAMQASSVKKGETLIDTALTLNTRPKRCLMPSQSDGPRGVCTACPSRFAVTLPIAALRDQTSCYLAKWKIASA